MNDSTKLDNLVVKSRRVLFEANTVFPFDFFPDKIRIDENKVDMVYRHFFFEKHVVSILIGDINTVVLSSGVFFATIHIQLNKPKPAETDIYLGEPINYLWKKDAIKIRRIILGLVAVHQQKIDLSKVPTENLAYKIEEIGKAREYPTV
jgi:hypothetical protein